MSQPLPYDRLLAEPLRADGCFSVSGNPIRERKMKNVNLLNGLTTLLGDPQAFDTNFFPVVNTFPHV